MDSSHHTGPVLTKDTSFTIWKSDAKAYLRRKEVYTCCTAITPALKAKLDVTAIEKCAGILWDMLSQDVKSLVHEHEDDPSALWSALDEIFAPRKAGARFGAYRTLTSIHLRDGESLLSLSGRVSTAMTLLKNSRPDGFDIKKADEELHSVVLLMALPDEGLFGVLKAPFEQSSELKVSDIERAFANHQAFRSQHQGGDTSLEQNPLSGLAMVASAPSPTPTPTTPAAAAIVAPAVEACIFCKKAHPPLKCPDFLGLFKRNNNRPRGGNGGGATTSQSAPNASLLTHSTPSSADKRWNADSGTTSHMTPEKERLLNARPFRIPIQVANGVVVYSELVGDVLLKPLLNRRARRHCLLTHVLYVPGLSHNLISTTYLSRVHGLSVLMKGCIISFERDGEVLFEADIDERNQAYVREVDSSPISAGSAFSASGTLPLDLDLLHRRLGHHSDTQRVLSKNLVTGVKLASQKKPDPICEPCLAGKLNAAPFPSTGHRAEAPLDLVHSDLKQYSVFTREGYKYRVVFVDDHTSFKVVHHLKRKSDTFSAFKLFKAYAENHFGRTIKALQEDKGGEYMSNEFESYLHSAGIVRRHSVRNRPQQNGTAERANRTIDEHATAMLHEANLPPSFKALAVNAYIHVSNMHPTSHIPEDKTPFELWHKSKPNVEHLRVWGCLAYVHVQKDKRDTSGIHIQKCIFVGYPRGIRGWAFYNPVTQKTVFSEHAVFDERYFPGNSPAQMRKCPQIHPSVFSRLNHLAPPPPSTASVPRDDDDDDDDSPARPRPAPAPAPSPPSTPTPSPPPSPAPAQQQDPPSPIGVAARRRFHNQSTIHRPTGEWWRAYREPTPALQSDDDEPAAHAPAPPSDSSDDDDGFLLTDGNARVLLVAHEAIPNVTEFARAATHSDKPPRTYHEALRREDAHLWKEAAASEINSLLENCTWEVVDPPPGVKPIRSQWVFVIKHKSDGTVERYKARLVADGRRQRAGVDFNEIFSPTFKPATLRTIFALSAQHDMKLRSIDFSSAYLNGDLEEDVYMAQPEGFPQGRPDQLLKLLRSLYGLKQAGRQWYKKLAEKLASMGFKCLQSDRSCYVFTDGNVRIIIPIHVDDGVICAKTDSDIDRVIAQLGSSFKVKDLGPTEWFLGIKIERDAQTGAISLSQRQYASDMLKDFEMDSSAPVQTPMEPGLVLTKEMGPKTEEESKRYKSKYLSAVGSLMYLATQTRPDISYAVGLLARFNSNPGEPHWKAVKHLFRYIKGTLDFKLTYTRGPPLSHPFISYSDADHGGCKDSGKSTGGFMILMNGAPVSWRSKLQSTVSLSTTEAEYTAAMEAAKEMKWMRNLLLELGYPVTGPSPLLMDNQSAIQVAKNPEHHGRMKHLDLAFFWLRDEVASGHIVPQYVPTGDQLADILTKPLPRATILSLRQRLGLQ